MVVVELGRVGSGVHRRSAKSDSGSGRTFLVEDTPNYEGKECY